MLKFLYLIFLNFILLSCSGFEMVYGEKKSFATLNQNTNLKVSGDDSNLIRSTLKRKIGNFNDTNKLILEISSIKNNRKSITEKDQITTQYEVEYKINYLLTKNEGKCNITNFYSVVTSNYTSKSSGYSYGSNVGKVKTEKDLINLSISQFFDYILFHNNSLECKNEG